MPAGQQLLNGAGVRPLGPANLPREGSKHGASCLYDAKSCDVTSLASAWLDAAPKENSHAAEMMGPGAWLGSVSNKVKSSKSKKNANASGNKFPARGPVSSLRSALQAQGNQLMQELAMPMSASVPYSNEMCQWHESLCMSIPKDMLLPAIRPPPGLEDVVASRGHPGMFYAMDSMGASSWSASSQDEGAAAYPCLLRTSSASQQTSNSFKAKPQKDGSWFLL